MLIPYKQFKYFLSLDRMYHDCIENPIIPAVWQLIRVGGRESIPQQEVGKGQTRVKS